MAVIRLIQDLKEAEKLWREISPRRVIFDEWDFRYEFYKYEPKPICFRAAYEINNNHEELIGLMPLVDYAEYGHGFFAEEPCEENRVFTKSGKEAVIKEIYESLSGKIQFYDISGEDEFTKAFPLEDYKYFLPLQDYQSFNDFAQARFSRKKRHSLNTDFHKIIALNPKIIYGRKEDILKLFSLNNNNFSDSYLKSEIETSAWKDLLKLPYQWEIISVEINNEIQAVSLSVLYNNRYFYLINGTNYQVYSGLGKYLNRLNLERALELKADVWDVGLGDCNWKEAWHLDRLPQYEYLNF